MKTTWSILLLTLLTALTLAACAGSTTEPPPEIEGPALVLFYTDN